MFFVWTAANHDSRGRKITDKYMMYCRLTPFSQSRHTREFFRKINWANFNPSCKVKFLKKSEWALYLMGLLAISLPDKKIKKLRLRFD